MSLHPHQSAIMARLDDAFRSGARRPLVQAPTGSGKTVLAAHFVQSAVARGQRVAFTVPALSLIDQTFERFVERGIHPSHMGVIQGNHAWRRPHAPIQICSSQTLARRQLPLVDTVIVDEAHVRQKAVLDWMATDDATRPGLFVGLTATPWAQGLGKHFDALVKGPSLSELIKAGFLAPFRVFAPSKPDLEGVRTVAGDYHEGDLEERVTNPVLVADIVSTWLARAESRPTLVFCVNRKHAKLVAQQFASVGVETAYVDADTPREERDAIGRLLKSGALKVVVNIGCLTTGVDWPFVSCLVLARPTKSEMLFVQIVGRGLRTCDGKADCLVLDHSDTHARLGMVTEIDYDELCDGKGRITSARKKRQAKDPLPRCCPSCAAMMPVAAPACLACGYTWPIVSNVETVEGELVEIAGAGDPVPATGVKAMLRKQGKRSVYAQLIEMRREAIRRGRHYSPKWSDVNFKEIFGEWPKGFFAIQPEEPTPELRGWIRHKAIKYAKSQDRRATVTGGHAHV